MSIDEKIKEGLKEIVKELVNENYNKLKQLNKLGVLKPEEVKNAVEEYLIGDEKLTLPPEEVFKNDVKIVEITNPKKHKREFGVFLDLWVNNEKSDLTLHSEAWEDEKDEVYLSLYEIRVF